MDPIIVILIINNKVNYIKNRMSAKAAESSNYSRMDRPQEVSSQAHNIHKLTRIVCQNFLLCMAPEPGANYPQLFNRHSRKFVSLGFCTVLFA